MILLFDNRSGPVSMRSPQVNTTILNVAGCYHQRKKPSTRKHQPSVARPSSRKIRRISYESKSLKQHVVNFMVYFFGNLLHVPIAISRSPMPWYALQCTLFKSRPDIFLFSSRPLYRGKTNHSAAGSAGTRARDSGSFPVRACRNAAMSSAWPVVRSLASCTLAMIVIASTSRSTDPS
jgi:hypothetical protein